MVLDPAVVSRGLRIHSGLAVGNKSILTVFKKIHTEGEVYSNFED